MTDNELLLAIGDIMDKKLNARIGPLENDIASLKNDVSTLKNDVGTLKNDVDTLKREVTLLKLQNENEIIPRLQNIEACYTSTFNRYKNSVDGYEAMQSDIELLKEISRERSEKLQMIS